MSSVFVLLDLDPSGACFMCLKQILKKRKWAKGGGAVAVTPPVPEEETNNDNNTTAAARAFKLLTRYLKLDVERVLGLGAAVVGASPVVVPSTGGSVEVGVPLCAACEALTRRFSELYLRLELLRLKADGVVREIHGVMEAAGGRGEDKGQLLMEYSQKRARRGKNKSGGSRRRGLVPAVSEKLRGEVLRKCSTLLAQRWTPRVDLYRLDGSNNKGQNDDERAAAIADLQTRGKRGPKKMGQTPKAAGVLYQSADTNKPFKCELCSSSFELEKTLQDHVYWLHREQFFAAYMTKEPTPTSLSLDEFKADLATVIDGIAVPKVRNGAFNCEFCEIVVTPIRNSRIAVKDHWIRHHMDQLGPRLRELQRKKYNKRSPPPPPQQPESEDRAAAAAGNHSKSQFDSVSICDAAGDNRDDDEEVIMVPIEDMDHHHQDPPPASEHNLVTSGPHLAHFHHQAEETTGGDIGDTASPNPNPDVVSDLPRHPPPDVSNCERSDGGGAMVVPSTKETDPPAASEPTNPNPNNFVVTKNVAKSVVSFKKPGKGNGGYQRSSSRKRPKTPPPWVNLRQLLSDSHCQSTRTSPFKCDSCDCSFEVQQNLQDHVLWFHHHHRDQVFPSEHQFEADLVRVIDGIEFPENPKGPFKCVFCGIVPRKSRAALKKHWIRRHMDQLGAAARLMELQKKNKRALPPQPEAVSSATAAAGNMDDDDSPSASEPKKLVITSVKSAATTTAVAAVVDAQVADPQASQASNLAMATTPLLRRTISKHEILNQCSIWNKTIQKHCIPIIPTQEKEIGCSQAQAGRTPAFKCDHCPKSFQHGPSLTEHKYLKHRSLFFAKHKEPSLTLEQFEALLVTLFRSIMEVPNKVRTGGGAHSCRFCEIENPMRSRGAVRVHLMRYHMEDELIPRLKELQKKLVLELQVVDVDSSSASGNARCSSSANVTNGDPRMESEGVEVVGERPPLICTYCDQLFDSSSDVLGHSVLEHGSQLFAEYRHSGIPSQDFDRLVGKLLIAELSIRQAWKGDDDDYKCPFCDFTSAKQLEAIIHLFYTRNHRVEVVQRLNKLQEDYIADPPVIVTSMASHHHHHQASTSGTATNHDEEPKQEMSEAMEYYEEEADANLENKNEPPSPPPPTTPADLMELNQVGGEVEEEESSSNCLGGGEDDMMILGI